ncbi:uncharacterized protein LOC125375882 [Haliotis rufescens]|uniref:uncharacterized protein LOC125375882 n=1 Tax=Haliotis rufescens TaxID=6454 RepID=UPI00201ECA8D|nr:uncharacterized protein LOC125375882 [Haliotis rufescens]
MYLHVYTDVLSDSVLTSCVCVTVSTTYRPCDWGRFGETCDQACPPGCALGSDRNTNYCQTDTGTCTRGCRRGWHGDRCEKLCGWNCIANTCHQGSGHCTHGCRGRYTGEFCEAETGEGHIAQSMQLMLSVAVLIFLTMCCWKSPRSRRTFYKGFTWLIRRNPRSSEDFFHICGFPKVVGCIDCTLIPIQRPALEEAVYVCRKGFHAINVQAVCDAQLRFTNIIVQWPGSTHDSHIFNNCNLKRHLEEGKYDIWLLGDSGYACRPYLLTPVNNPANEKEEKYNGCHIGTRNSVERAFGLCKSRFRCLHKSTGCLLFSPQKSIKIITACFQLHYLAILLRLPDPDVLCENPGPEGDSSPADNHNIDGCRGQALSLDVTDVPLHRQNFFKEKHLSLLLGL